jgi:glycosyltransferase involved in cell wall biosynthesis
MTTPFVSVIMPAYNSERYITDAIRSLLSQSGVDIEVIIISDGSTDGTNAIVTAFANANSRVRLFDEPHRGVAAARNVGLAAAKADFVTFLDSDDLCAPERLQRQTMRLLANDAIDAVIGDMMLFDIAGSDGRPAPNARTVSLTGASLTTVLFRRRVLQKIGVCDETLPYAEDIDLLLRLWESRAVLDFDGEVAIFYRRHNTNMTNNQEAVTRHILRAMHRSLIRRRQAGNLEPLPSFFSGRKQSATWFRNG